MQYISITFTKLLKIKKISLLTFLAYYLKLQKKTALELSTPVASVQHVSVRPVVLAVSE